MSRLQQSVGDAHAVPRDSQAKVKPSVERRKRRRDHPRGACQHADEAAAKQCAHDVDVWHQEPHDYRDHHEADHHDPADDGSPGQEDRQQEPRHRNRDERSLYRRGNRRARRAWSGSEPERFGLVAQAEFLRDALLPGLASRSDIGPESRRERQYLVPQGLGIGQAQELELDPRLAPPSYLDGDLGEAEDPPKQRLHDIHRLQPVEPSLALLTEEPALALLDRLVGDPERVKPPRQVACRRSATIAATTAAPPRRRIDTCSSRGWPGAGLAGPL